MHRSRIRHLRPSGRSIISFLMAAIMVVGIAGGMTATAAAQGDETLLGQTAVEWTAPWQNVDPAETLGNSLAIDLPELDPQNRLDLTNDNSHVILASLSAAADMTAVTDAVLTTFAQDPGNAVEVAGGADTAPNAEYRAYLFNLDGQEVGVYIRLGDDASLEIFLAPVTVFADEMNAAQSMITVDGVAVLDGVDGAAIASALAARTGEALPITSQNAGVGGEYLVPNYNLQVAWPAGWSIVSQDERGIVLTDANQTMTVYIQGDEFQGDTWEQTATRLASLYVDDQGENATMSGFVVTDRSIMFTSDGQYGPRMVQAFPTTDPATFTLVFAADIQPGADLAALATQAREITIDGEPILQGIEAVLSPAP